jgi:hypothetical protein
LNSRLGQRQQLLPVAQPRSLKKPAFNQSAMQRYLKKADGQALKEAGGRLRQPIPEAMMSLEEAAEASLSANAPFANKEALALERMLQPIQGLGKPRELTFNQLNKT